MTTSRKNIKKVSVPGKSCSVRELDAWILKIGGRVITPSQKKKIFKEVRWAKIPGESAPV
jgi:isopentenyl phosphate kinase